MTFKTFVEFAKGLDRSFPVHEYCHDCAEFYHGCNAWPEKKEFGCADYRRLPDVMVGASGQMFPPSRMRGRKEPRAHAESAADRTEPQSQQPSTESRRRYMRKYMREYMRRRRATSSAPQCQSQACLLRTQEGHQMAAESKMLNTVIER